LALLGVWLAGCAAAPPVPSQTSVEPPPSAPQVVPPPAPPAPRPALASSTPAKDLRIIVKKAQRELQVLAGDEPIRHYRVALGFAPRGHKRQEGDGRTPEGQYYVARKNPDSRFFMSLGLSYPNLRDAEKAYFDGRVSWAQYQAVARAIRSHGLPPSNTPLGGMIFIHGAGARPDWTKGCIALDDRDIRELYRLVEVGTPVIIQP
jgi:murein L,D-transpeptidase YafK